MTISNHKNRNHVADENDAATAHSHTQDSMRLLNVVRNHGYDRPAPASGDERRQSLPYETQARANEGQDPSGITELVRRPYLKPAFQYEVVFKRVLMKCVGKTGAAAEVSPRFDAGATN